MIFLAFRSTINIYDVARFNRTVFYAAEPLPAAPLFAAGQGPGLWRKPVGAGGHPTPVAGSEARRFYGITAFELPDGTQQLCAIGVRTADIYAYGDFPQVLSLWTPDPLIFFVSEDGENWTEHELGSIEKGAGPYTQYRGDVNVRGLEEGGLVFYPDNIQNAWMNDAGHWSEAPDRDGVPCLWRSIGRHELKWNGETLSAKSLALGTVEELNAVPVREIPDRASDLAIASGRRYFTRNRQAIVGDGGALVLYRAYNLQRIAPKFGDPERNYPETGAPLDIAFENGTPRALGKYRGLWPLFFSVDSESALQVLAAQILPRLPDETITINCAKAPAQVFAEPSLFYDLGQDGGAAELMTVRSAAGRSYLVQQKDFQDAGDATKAEIAVLETLVAPRIEDFWIDSGLNPDPNGGAGALLFGTDDGYILTYDAYTGTIIVIGKIDGPVLKLALACNQLFALSPTSLWWSDDWNTPNPTLQVLAVAAPGYHYTDFVTTSDDRLFLVSNNGTDSRVEIWAICSNAGVIDGEPTFINEYIFDDVIVTVIVELPDGTVLILGENGVVISYDDNNVSTVTTVPALANEIVTAAAVSCDAVLYIGTQSGKIYKLENGVWSLVATLNPTAAITSIVVINCVLYLTVEGDDGTYWTYDPATDTLAIHHGDSDVNVIIRWGDNGIITGGSGGAEFDTPVAGRFVSQIIDNEGPVTQVLVAPLADSGALPLGCRIWVRAEPSATAPGKSNGYVPALGGAWRPIARRDSEDAARAYRVLVVPGVEPLGAIMVQASGAGAEE